MKHYLKYIFLVLLLIASAATYAADISDAAKKYAHPEISIQDDDLQKLIKTNLQQYINTLSDEQLVDAERLIALNKDAIKKILESQGYYKSTITHSVDNEGKLTYKIEKGRPYKISAVRINADANIKLPENSILKSHTGNNLVAENITDDLKTITDYIESNNCIANLEVTYDAIVDDKNNQAEVIFNAVGLNNIHIGSINLDGLTSVRPKYINKTLLLKEGECYSRANIDKAKIKLYETGLFSSVDVAEKYTDENKADLALNFKEKDHRTIKAGAGYNLDEGIYFTTGWEHRNYFHNGEKLNLNAKMSTILQQLEAKLTMPSFIAKNSLTLNADIKQESNDSYDGNSISLGATLQRKFSNKLSISHGPNFKVSSVEKAGVTEEYAFILYPVIFLLDKRDNVLDPTKGFSVSYEIDPYVNTLNPEVRFIKNIAKASIYKTFENTKFKPTIAAKGGFGSIFGLDDQDMPADQRFYVGGGGSVRGYEYQTLGPMLNGEPYGGNSFTEVGLEARLRFNEQWGGVAFIDGGEAYSTSSPKFGGDMNFAYGLGARYFTSFAPIRFDVALPMNPRPEDAAYQFYISIGQAF